MSLNRREKATSFFSGIVLIAITGGPYLVDNLTQKRLYIYSIVPDDEDPTPNAMIKTDITDLVTNQGYKLLNKHYIWVPETKRPTLSPDDWVRIKKGFVRAAKLVLPKSEWTDLEAFEPIRSTHYLVSDYIAGYPSHIFETRYIGTTKKL